MNNGGKSDKDRQQQELVLEISSPDETSSSNNKTVSNSLRRGGVNLPMLDSLEGTIIKEQDGQQYYVVYDVPASDPIIQFEK